MDEKRECSACGQTVSEKPPKVLLTSAQLDEKLEELHRKAKELCGDFVFLAIRPDVIGTLGGKNVMGTASFDDETIIPISEAFIGLLTRRKG